MFSHFPSRTLVQPHPSANSVANEMPFQSIDEAELGLGKAASYTYKIERTCEFHMEIDASQAQVCSRNSMVQRWGYKITERYCLDTGINLKAKHQKDPYLQNSDHPEEEKEEPDCYELEPAPQDEPGPSRSNVLQSSRYYSTVPRREKEDIQPQEETDCYELKSAPRHEPGPSRSYVLHSPRYYSTVLRREKEDVQPQEKTDCYELKSAPRDEPGPSRSYVLHSPRYYSTVPRREKGDGQSQYHKE